MTDAMLSALLKFDLIGGWPLIGLFLLGFILFAYAVGAVWDFGKAMFFPDEEAS